VRDLLLGRQVHDWDLATSLLPEQVTGEFDHTVPTGLAHGTVTVIQDGTPVEVTTLRREGPYCDGRRPSAVSFDADLSADLSRRDFTINAMALAHRSSFTLASGFLRDPFDGLVDLARRTVRAVGDPATRFAEDHLRVLRAHRFVAELGFELEPATADASRAWAPELPKVAAERIQAELNRVVLSPHVFCGLESMRHGGVLGVILPELAATVGFEQNEFHPYDVWTHSALACSFVPPVLHLRLAALLHDVGKPLTMTIDADGRRHFYGHEQVSAQMAEAILSRLRYDRTTIAGVGHLVGVHMDFHDLPTDASDAAVRRAAARVGRENISDLLRLRHADRLAAGKQGPVSPGTLRLLARLAALERSDAALSLHDLQFDGRRVMEVTGIRQGPEVGHILHQLLLRVIEDPALNNPADLERLAMEIHRAGS